ncbi:sorbosone dehydrogenase family protein [Sinorhizobium meliloti]|nr:sorbosone dehydrogenase family protein [Sinorhizobium meliloti]MDW9800694.1 sorbosone dehydrogenase family protein [Sinorhizobium meliloti]
MSVSFPRAGFLALVMVVALAFGVPFDAARGELLARVPAAREMAVCGDTLFVGTKGSSVYAVSLPGGRARRVASGFSNANGVACSRGRLFVASRSSITAFEIGRGGTLSGRRDIRRDLPNSGAHSFRYIALGPDARLYVSLGSPCNICVPRGLQGTIVSMNQDGSDLRRVAWGVRNSVGFDWRGGRMFFTDNGADRMGDDVPPDELNALRPGGFYGFPYFGGQVPLTGFEDAMPPARQVPPVFNFQAHVAALGIHFFRSLGGDALVAQHGSWNRSVPVGYQVVRVRFRGGRPGSAATFLRNVGRPVDVKEAPDGAILVSDDAGGAIHIFRR